MVIVNIRNISERLYRKIRARAKKAGMSVPAYALMELRKSAEILTDAEIRRRIAKLPPIG